MTELSYRGRQYRLRAGTPMPTQAVGRFVWHTFMAEVNDTDMIACTSSLPGSEEFRGQGGTMMSASFSRLNVKGGEIFSGRVIYAPEYIDEDEIPQ